MAAYVNLGEISDHKFVMFKSDDWGFLGTTEELLNTSRALSPPKFIKHTHYMKREKMMSSETTYLEQPLDTIIKNICQKKGNFEQNERRH